MVQLCNMKTSSINLLFGCSIGVLPFSPCTCRDKEGNTLHFEYVIQQAKPLGELGRDYV